MIHNTDIFNSDSIYKQLLDETEAYIYTKDLSSRYTYVNKLMQELLGKKEEEILGKKYDDFFTIKNTSKLERYEQKVLQQGRTIIKNNTFKIRQTGDIKVFHSVKKPIYRDGKIIGLMGVSTDITTLKNEKEEFEAMFHRSQESIGIVDMNSNFLRVNSAYCKMLGYTKKELLNTTCTALTHKDDVESSKKAMKEVLEVGYVKSFVKRCIAKSGKVITVDMSMSFLHNPSRILFSLKDISDVKKYQIKLERLASTDPLTKLYNRRYFNEVSHTLIDQSLKTGASLSLMIIDIDNFKTINDTYGHQAGDEILIALAKKLKKCVRKNDIIARIGGDEFIILLPNATQSNSIKIAENIRKEVATIDLSHYNISFTISLGLATLQKGDTLDLLLKRADKMLYLSKEEGKNRVSYQ